MAVEAVRIGERRLASSFRTLSVHEARALVLYGIERRRPMQLVVGRAGSGKTRLLGALSRTEVDGGDLVLLRTLPETFEEVIDLLAGHFGVGDAVGESPFERLARLADVLADRRRAGRLVALLVDDVHAASSGALLDLRLLIGTDAEGGALLPLVIAGRPELAGRLAEPALESLRLTVSTHIELRRPLPAADGDFESEGESPGIVPRRSARWPRTVATCVALCMVLAATLFGLRPAPRPPAPAAVVAPIREATVDPAPAPLDVPALPPAPPALPEPSVEPSSGRVTATSARGLVEEFADALASQDLVRLERTLARDVRQNGIRGRRAILESYAYRFARLDAPISLDAPSRITLRDGTALADVPFASSYRDAGGNAGTVDGTLRLRVVRHGGRPVIDSLDWAFGEGGP